MDLFNTAVAVFLWLPVFSSVRDKWQDQMILIASSSSTCRTTNSKYLRSEWAWITRQTKTKIGKNRKTNKKAATTTKRTQLCLDFEMSEGRGLLRALTCPQISWPFNNQQVVYFLIFKKSLSILRIQKQKRKKRIFSKAELRREKVIMNSNFHFGNFCHR